MKFDRLAALVFFGLITSAGIFAGLEHLSRRTACAIGDRFSCHVLAERKQWGEERDEQEQQRREKLLLGSVLSASCEQKVKAQLKDPNSYQRISFDFPFLVYSATNSFGGRVRDTHICS